MKKIISALLALSLLFCMSACTETEEKEKNVQQAVPKTNYQYVKAVWIAYYEISDMLKNLDEKAAGEKLDACFAELSSIGINTVFFHVRAFEDAFYNSAFFPRTSYVSSDYDVLKIAVSKAHKYKLSFHAWINPYRAALNTSVEKLSVENPAKKLYVKNKDNILIYNNGVFLNPASIDAQKLIINGVREIINNYNVDGIHFDDYFYPTPDESIDKNTYLQYKKQGGALGTAEYRRENVNALIAGVYAAVKQKNKNILFGISPQASVAKNYDTLFADIETWLKNGYIDYICPQIYFGFKNESSPFKETADSWKTRVKNTNIKLLCGLALYKSGIEDTYASANPDAVDSPYYEWCNYDDIISRQIGYVNSLNVGGYAIYSYSAVFNDGSNKNLNTEVENMKAKLKEK